MGLSRTISEGTAISIENQFFQPVYLTPRPKGSLVIGYRRVYRQKARIIALPRTEKEVRRYLQPSGHNYTNVTDGRTPADNKDRSTA